MLEFAHAHHQNVIPAVRQFIGIKVQLHGLAVETRLICDALLMNWKATLNACIAKIIHQQTWQSEFL